MSYNNTFKIWAGQGAKKIEAFAEFFRNFEIDETLNSTNPLARLGPDLQFTRNTSATFYSGSSSINTVGNNIPRFEYSINGSTFDGLLIEETRTNLAPYSNDFTTSQWIPASNVDGPGVSIQTNVPNVLAPDGTYTANKMYMNPARGYRGITWVELPYPEIPTEGDSYARSIYVKKDTARFITLGCDSTTDAPNTTNVFDLDNPGFNDGNLFYTFWEGPNKDGWYRIGFYRNSSNINTNKFTIGISPSKGPYEDTFYPDTTISETASSVFIWGAQMEQGWMATSYIPTNGTQVSRASDKVTTSFNNFLTFYNLASSSILVKGSKKHSYFGTFLSIDNINRGYLIDIGVREEPFFTNYLQISTGSAGFNTYIETQYPVIGFELKDVYYYGSLSAPKTLVAGIANNDMAFYLNQQLLGLSTVNVFPPAGSTKFYLGSINGTYSFLNGHILGFHYWPYKFDNATLQTLTL